MTHIPQFRLTLPVICVYKVHMLFHVQALNGIGIRVYIIIPEIKYAGP